MGKDDSAIVGEKKQIASREMPGSPAIEDLEPGEFCRTSALLPHYWRAQARRSETEEANYVA